MKIDVISFTDNGELTLDLDEEAQQLLIKIAINKILSDKIKHIEEKQENGKKLKNIRSTVCDCCGVDLMRPLADQITKESSKIETEHFTNDD